MIVLDTNAVLGSKTLKGTFCGGGFDRKVINLRVDVSHVTEVVDKDGSAAIVLLGESAFELRHKP